MTDIDKDAAIREAAASTQPEVYLAAIHQLFVVTGDTLANHEMKPAKIRRDIGCALEAEWNAGTIDGPTYYLLAERLGLPANPMVKAKIVAGR